SIDEQQQTHATGMIWRPVEAIAAWTRGEIEAADGLSQTILMTENQNVAHWWSQHTFNLAFVVGLDRITLGPDESPFLVQRANLGPYGINANRGTLPGQSPAPSSLHPNGVNVLL